ncbi:GntR family transcriptional regulator [Candidatus Nomurabacteria bacterium]|nr:GntR family transcriptional regulator [Candidatus Nomurabacteria bacterium]
MDMPKYEMVKNYVKHLLIDNAIAFGDKLPSENELTEKFQVSRQTVRQAFSELTSEGYIYKEQGRGTFSKYKKKANQKQIVAVLTTYLSGFVFPGILAGVEQVLSEEVYIILLSNTNNTKKREAQYLENILEHNVVGLIIEPTKSACENVNIRLLETLRDKGIKTVFINACYDEIRRLRRHPSTPLEPVSEENEENEDAIWLTDPNLQPDEVTLKKDTMAAVADCMRSLPDEYRLVLLLIDVQEFNYQDAADMISKPLGTIKSRLLRARLRMRACLEAKGELYRTQIRTDNKDLS